MGNFVGPLLRASLFVSYSCLLMHERFWTNFFIHDTLIAEHMERNMRTADMSERWNKLMRHYHMPDGYAKYGFEYIQYQYGNRSRTYYNLQYLARCLAELDRCASGADILDCGVEVALWYHRVISRHEPHDRERSAARMCDDMRKFTIEPVRRRIAALIHATSHMRPAHTFEEKLTCDIACAHFGADEAAYRAYTEALRGEFANFNDEAFRESRAAAIRGFLGRRTIYYLPEFRNLYEERAQANLRRELDALVPSIAA